MCFYALAADFAAGAVAPALTIMEFQFVPHTSVSKLSQLVAVSLTCILSNDGSQLLTNQPQQVSTLLLGTSNIFWVPLGNIFGRRPILIVSLVFLLLTSVWCGLAEGFPSLLAARALQGASSGPVYTFAPEITGDIFFHHERGRAMVAYTMCLAAGPFIAGVSGGYIAAALGYRWLFWISAILVAFTLVLEVLIVPETLFDRAHHLRQEEDEGNTTSPGLKNESTTKENIAESDRTPQPAWTYVQSLKCGMYRGNIGHHFLAPWLSLLFPGTWVVMLLYGGLVAAIVTTATVGPIFLSQPPYLWGADVGLINFGGLIGVVVGGAITFFTADSLVTLAAKKDSHGLSEPETRLVSLFPGIFLAVTGLWTFGFCAANPSPNAWAGLAVGGGMISAATTTVPSIGFNYVSIFPYPCPTHPLTLTSSSTPTSPYTATASS
jgi:MFS family permease